MICDFWIVNFIRMSSAKELQQSAISIGDDTTEEIKEEEGSLRKLKRNSVNLNSKLAILWELDRNKQTSHIQLAQKFSVNRSSACYESKGEASETRRGWTAVSQESSACWVSQLGGITVVRQRGKVKQLTKRWLRCKTSQ